jgi:hypothetical protein
MRARGTMLASSSTPQDARRVCGMSVLVTARFEGDTDQFRRLLETAPERFAEIAPEAKAAGCLHHRFGIGEGFVLVVDEWESAEAFQTFFSTNEKIPAIVRDAGASGEPQIIFSEAISSPDQF